MPIGVLSSGSGCVLRGINAPRAQPRKARWALLQALRHHHPGVRANRIRSERGTSRIQHPMWQSVRKKMGVSRAPRSTIIDDDVVINRRASVLMIVIDRLLRLASRKGSAGSFQVA